MPAMLLIDAWRNGGVIEIDPERGSVDVRMTLTSPMCPIAPEILEAALLITGGGLAVGSMSPGMVAPHGPAWRTPTPRTTTTPAPLIRWWPTSPASPATAMAGYTRSSI